jgi:hypothetical protein
MQSFSAQRHFRLWGPALFLGLAVSACSGTGRLVLGDAIPEGGIGSPGVGGSGWIGTDAAIPIDDVVCAGIDVLALTPVLYLVLDRSNDMQFTAQQQQQSQSSKWNDLVNALTSPMNGYFTSDAGRQWTAAGLGVYPNSCQFRTPTGDCSMGSQACTAGSYMAPNVAIGPVSNIVDFLPTAPGPAGITAMRIALNGALQDFIGNWDKSNTTKSFAVPVIVAGNPPQSGDCMPNTTNAIAAVADNTDVPAPGNAHSRTFVVAFENDNGANNNGGPLDQIARAGGTNNAYDIDPDRPQQLGNALDDIRSRSCMFQLPPNSLDASLTLETPGDGSRHPDSIFNVMLRSRCGSTGHDLEVYKDPNDVTRVIGCDAMCKSYYELARAGASVQLESLDCTRIR